MDNLLFPLVLFTFLVAFTFLVLSLVALQAGLARVGLGWLLPLTFLGTFLVGMVAIVATLGLLVWKRLRKKTVTTT